MSISILLSSTPIFKKHIHTGTRCFFSRLSLILLGSPYNFQIVLVAVGCCVINGFSKVFQFLLKASNSSRQTITVSIKYCMSWLSRPGYLGEIARSDFSTIFERRDSNGMSNFIEIKINTGWCNYKIKDPGGILARTWQDLGKILARSWQDPGNILARSRHDLDKILARYNLAKIKIMNGI